MLIDFVVSSTKAFMCCVFLLPSFDDRRRANAMANHENEKKKSSNFHLHSQKNEEKIAKKTKKKKSEKQSNDVKSVKRLQTKNYRKTLEIFIFFCCLLAASVTFFVWNFLYSLGLCECDKQWRHSGCQSESERFLLFFSQQLLSWRLVSTVTRNTPCSEVHHELAGVISIILCSLLRLFE